MQIQCKDCPHRKWDNDDGSEFDVGMGWYYCELTDITLGSELKVKGTHCDCPLPEQLELF